ncbi:MAG: hypothetical protein Q8K96_14775 [Rubrivivax sp.]|nr:hypothetical protein [Rubrivivax sp.]
MPQAAPRLFAPSLLQGAGLPGDRGARLAARQALVSLKLSFIEALDGLPAVEWLRCQIRSAEQPVDLWLLRAPVFAALEGAENEHRLRRQKLRRGLDSMFQDLDEPTSAFASLY